MSTPRGTSVAHIHFPVYSCLVFSCLAFSFPTFSCPALSCVTFSIFISYFWCRIFMSRIFMPRSMVPHFHVSYFHFSHFQRPHLSLRSVIIGGGGVLLRPGVCKTAYYQKRYFSSKWITKRLAAGLRSHRPFSCKEKGKKRKERKGGTGRGERGEKEKLGGR